jgi:hypothetical protein
MFPFVTPSEQATIEVDFSLHRVIEKSSELAHASMVQPIIILVCSSINHVEVAIQEPWTIPITPELTELFQECRLACISGRTIN